MKNLLPDFILENYKNNVFEGKMNAFTIFSDISGFTPMTEKLMEKGNEGAEILSEILKKVFKPTVKCVYNSGGFITNFAGDSFTSLIPLSTGMKNSNGYPENALRCSNNILNEIKNLSSVKTGYGEVDLKVRIGMSVGNVEWGIIGREFKSFYFRGEAINDCAEAQQKTAVNEILFHNNIYRLLKNKNIQFSRKGNYYYLRDHSLIPEQSAPQRLIQTSNLTKQIFSKNFIPETVFSVKEEGEFREVASVFISFDPGLSKAIIEGLFSNIIAGVNHYSGYLKDIDFGDKGGVIVCYFGAPVSSEEDAQRAISFVKFLKKKLAADETLKEIKLRIGVTYGKVYTGFLGGDERVQYCIMGNLVNLCARFMSKAGWDEVWICEDTYRRIRNKNDFISIGYLPFKGFNNEIPVYKHIDKYKEKSKANSITVLKPVHMQNSHSGKMIGREKEIGNLKLFTEKIFENKTSGIIYVTGEAGIGKSRLIREFRKDFSASNKITWLYCYASELLNTPLLPFKYLLKNFFKQSASNTPEENKRVFDNIVDIIVKRLDNLSIENKDKSADYIQIKDELLRTNSILAAMIDIYWNNSLYEQLEPELRFENTLFAICNFVMAECMLQPVVLEIEDVHWLDNDSREVLKMLLHNITSLPLTILCTSRHIIQRSRMLTDANKERHEILLNYLYKKDIKDFAFDILKTEIDDPAAEFILKNTNGNPYFAEQLIMDFKDKNKWKMKKNILSLSDHDGQNIPSSINSVLISRFDRLPENVKNTVQTASVLGREFELRVLKNMYPDDNEIESKIRTAEDEKVWYSGEEGKIIFTHALLRKAVHEMQMKSVVNDLHLRAAETIKKLSGKKVSHHNSEQISYHLGLGHNIVNNKNKVIVTKEKLKDEEFRKYAEEYLEYQISIADKYKTDYRNEKALELYNLILELSDKLNDKEQSYNILIKKVEILNNVSRWDDAKKEVDKAMKIAKGMKDKYKEMVALRYIAENCYYKNDFNISLNIFNRALKYFKKANYSIEVIYILDVVGKIFMSIGNYKMALSTFNDQLILSKNIGDENFKALSFYNIGSIFRRKGEFDKSLNYLNLSLRYFKKSNNKIKIALTIKLIGVIYFHKNNLGNSLKYFKIAQKAFRELGDKNNYAISLGNIGNVYLFMEDYEEAKIYFDEQLYINKQVNNSVSLSLTYLNMAFLYMGSSNYVNALKYFLEQKTVLSKYKKLDSLPTILSNIGKIYSYKGKIKKAFEAHFEQLRIEKLLFNKDGIVKAIINIANLYDVIGDYNKALSFIKKGIYLSVKYKFEIHLQILYFNYSDILLKLKKFKLAGYYCNKLLKKNYLAKSNFFIHKSLFLKDNIQLQNYIYSKRNKSISNNNLRKLFRRMELNLNKFNSKESIAEGHFNLFVIAKRLIDFHIKTPEMNYHKETSLRIYNEIKTSINPTDYKKRMRILLK